MLPKFASDLLRLLLDTVDNRNGLSKAGEFQRMWARDVWRHWVVRKAWKFVHHSRPAPRFFRSIHATRRAICGWNREQFGFSVQTNIAKKRQELEAILNSAPSNLMITKEDLLRLELNELSSSGGNTLEIEVQGPRD